MLAFVVVGRQQDGPGLMVKPGVVGVGVDVDVDVGVGVGVDVDVDVVAVEVVVVVGVGVGGSPVSGRTPQPGRRVSAFVVQRVPQTARLWTTTLLCTTPCNTQPYTPQEWVDGAGEKLDLAMQ